MKASRIWILVMILAAFCLLAVGCSNGPAAQETIESGVIDTEYSGIPTAPVAQAYKVDEEAKENMIKITIKCGVEKEIPIENTEQPPDEARPKI